MLEEDLGFLHKKLVRGKDKCETFLKQREFCLEIKPQKLNCIETKQEEMEEPPEFNLISNDVWYHVSKYIQPEYVQTFALICSQTAALVRTKSFWKHLFLKYCQKFDEQVWILQLPANLQFDHIRNYSPAVFRASVIQALFVCYAPFTSRINTYSLDLLIGRTYISAWHKLWENCMWIMCYQFKQSGLSKADKKITKRNIMQKKQVEADIVNDWETLAISEIDTVSEETSSLDEEDFSIEEQNIYEGVCLLVIFSHRFIPFPTELAYEANTSCHQTRLAAVRRPLTSDMREYNLELDFLNTINKNKTTMKYPTVKHKVLPWWHPEFKKYIKFEACDKFT